MTSLRDARFEKALAHAPDVEGAQASAAVRATIRAAAQRAVEPSPRPGWWQRLFPVGQRMPWSAALASVLVASFVTVLWRGGDQLPDEAMVTAPPPAPSAPPASASPPPQAATKRAPATMPGPAAVQDRVAPAAPQVAPPDARNKAAAAQTAVAERRDSARQAQEVRTAGPVPSPAEPPLVAQAVPAPGPAPASAVAPSLGRAAASPPSPAPAPAAAPVRRLETGPATREQGAVPMPAWDAVRLEYRQSAVVVPRAQAANFAISLGELLADRRQPAPSAPPSPTEIRIVLSAGSSTTGQLTLGDDAVTWQPAGGARATWLADGGRLGSLRTQALLLLQR